MAPIYLRTGNAVADAAITVATPVAAAKTCMKIPIDMPSTETKAARDPCAIDTLDTYKIEGPGVKLTAIVIIRNKRRVSIFISIKANGSK